MSDDSTNLRQEFVTELESILESDEAYGSNVQILTYALKEDVINGKFKDSWNNRVYEFIIDADGISYKPAVKLDSFSTDEMPGKFDSYSEGYGSLFGDARSDGKLTGKRTKKPKCGVTAYGCGFSCIGLIKTCKILSTGTKAGSHEQGKAIGKERLTKLIARANALDPAQQAATIMQLKSIAKGIESSRNRYTSKGKARESERALARQPEVKAPVKPQEKKLIKSKSESTTNALLGKPVKSYNDFQDKALAAYDKLNKEKKLQDLVPIHAIRKEFAEKVEKKQFDKWLLEMQDKDIIQLMSGDTGAMSPEERKESLTMPGGSVRHLIKKL